MKPPLFIVAVILSIVPLILVINLIFMGQKNQSLESDVRDLQSKMQSQQVEINKGTQSQQIGIQILRDMGTASLKDPAIRDILSKNGYSVTLNASPSPAPGSSPAAASSPAAMPSATP